MNGSMIYVETPKNIAINKDEDYKMRYILWLHKDI